MSWDTHNSTCSLENDTVEYSQIQNQPRLYEQLCTQSLREEEPHRWTQGPYAAGRILDSGQLWPLVGHQHPGLVQYYPATFVWAHDLWPHRHHSLLTSESGISATQAPSVTRVVMVRTWALVALTNQVWLLVRDNPIRWVTVGNGGRKFTHCGHSGKNSKKVQRPWSASRCEVWV